MFGMFHIYIFRILPTAILGIMLTFIVYKTGSIYLGMIGHFINNGLVISIISFPIVRHYFGWLAGERPFSILGVSGVIGLLALGTFLIIYSNRSVGKLE